MKKFAFIAGWSVILLINFWSLYDSFEYFSKNLTDLIYVFAIAIAGGIAFWIYGKCSQKLQRRIRLIFLCSIAIAGSLTWIALLFTVMQFARDLFSGKVIIYLVAFGLFNVTFTYLVWREFYRMRKDCR